MGPLVQRSWAPCAQTPVLMQRGRSRLKVSVIGALVISPRRHRVRAYFGIQADANFDGERILQFLQQLCRALRVPIELLWLYANMRIARSCVAFPPNHHALVGAIANEYS
ncbi:MAG: hypothetical protein GEV05_29485 [Betaproteobacteria bacterium]|nr:hypothetical protein [Betaproteobacteria bacterium]